MSIERIIQILKQNYLLEKNFLDGFYREAADNESVLHDVTLISSDGGSVRASKTILAIQSPVFHRLFFGSFRESKQGCTSVEFNHIGTRALRGVVYFCYTGEIMEIKDSDFSASILHDLLDAADYFGIITRVRRRVILRIWSDKQDPVTEEEKIRLQALTDELGVENLENEVLRNN